MQTQYIAAWKSGTAVRWRGLTWSEFSQFTHRLTFESPIEVYLDLYRALLLEGPDPEYATAGSVEYVAKTMLETNPFGGKYEDVVHALHTKRGVQTYLENAKALVAGIFRYTFEEIDTWDADTFFDRVAKAEFLAGKKLEPEDPAVIAASLKAAKDPNRKPPPRPKKQMTDGQKLAWERVQGQQR